MSQIKVDFFDSLCDFIEELDLIPSLFMIPFLREQLREAYLQRGFTEDEKDTLSSFMESWHKRNHQRVFHKEDELVQVNQMELFNFD